jgi:type IV secretory pathway VirJ component
VHIYRSSAQPKHVVLFASGDGGWNPGVIDMARALAGLDALVAGIDITAYLKQLQSTSEACSYPAADFKGLSQYLLRHYGFTDYVVPVLVGYSSGATLVYATLAQAPPNTFRGGMSLGFCPDLPLTRPLCHGSGLKSTTGPHGKGYSFKPAPDLPPPLERLPGRNRPGMRARRQRAIRLANRQCPPCQPAWRGSRILRAMFNGIVSLVLAAVFIAGWPFTAAWLIGLFIGISLLFDGLSLLMLALAARTN